MLTSKKQLAYFLLILINISFGLVGLVVRRATDAGADIFLASASSWLLASACIYVFARRKEPLLSHLTTKRVKLSLVLQGVFFGLTNIFFFSALVNTTIASAEFIHKLMPIWVMLGSVVLLKEKLTPVKLSSLLLAIAGLYALVGFEQDIANIGTGELHALIASLFFAAMIINARRLKDVSHYASSFVQLFVGAMLVLPIALYQLPYEIIDMRQLLFAIGFLGIFLTAIPQAMLLFAFRYSDASSGSLFMLLQPVSATIIAWLVLGEQLSALQVGGAGMIALGVASLLLFENKSTNQ